MKATHRILHKRGYLKDFLIKGVSRADLEQAGFDTTNVDDTKMLELGSKMAMAYCDFAFWQDLEICAEYLGITKGQKV